MQLACLCQLHGFLCLFPLLTTRASQHALHSGHSRLLTSPWTCQAGPPMPICSVVPLVLPHMRPASSVLWLMKSQPPSGSLSPRAGPTVCSTSCCTGTQWVHSRVCMWAPQHASWKGGSWRQPSRAAPPGWGAAEDTPGRVTRHVCRLPRVWCLQAHRLDELWGPHSEAADKHPGPGGHMPTWAWTSPCP